GGRRAGAPRPGLHAVPPRGTRKPDGGARTGPVARQVRYGRTCLWPVRRRLAATAAGHSASAAEDPEIGADGGVQAGVKRLAHQGMADGDFLDPRYRGEELAKIG